MINVVGLPTVLLYYYGGHNLCVWKKYGKTLAHLKEHRRALTSGNLAQFAYCDVFREYLLGWSWFVDTLR